MNANKIFSLDIGIPDAQSEAMKGRMTVVLDLDGTLISSFTPRRAPSLPPGSTSYVVGKGAKLNPLGVLVVERPELRHFFSELNKFAGTLRSFSLLNAVYPTKASELKIARI